MSNPAMWLAAAVLVLASLPARAHPVDEVIEGAYLFLAPGELRLELDLTSGTEVIKTVLVALDPDADRSVTEAEARSFAETVLQQSNLRLDGQQAKWTVQKVTVPTVDSIEAAADSIKIYAVASRPDSAGAHTLSYENSYAPALSRRAANVFLQPGGNWQYRITAQQHSADGQLLTVDYTVSAP